MVELDHLAENLKCIKCNSELHLKDAVQVLDHGILSHLVIKCRCCPASTSVPTGKQHVIPAIYGSSKSSKAVVHADVNALAVLGNYLILTSNKHISVILSCVSVSLFESYC